MEPRCLWEALDCRAPFLESKWEPRGPGELEIPEQDSETGTDTETEGNGLEMLYYGVVESTSCSERTRVWFLDPTSGSAGSPVTPATWAFDLLLLALVGHVAYSRIHMTF